MLWVLLIPFHPFVSELPGDRSIPKLVTHAPVLSIRFRVLVYAPVPIRLHQCPSSSVSHDSLPPAFYLSALLSGWLALRFAFCNSRLPVSWRLVSAFWRVSQCPSRLFPRSRSASYTLPFSFPSLPPTVFSPFLDFLPLCSVRRPSRAASSSPLLSLSRPATPLVRCPQSHTYSRIRHPCTASFSSSLQTYTHPLASIPSK